MRWGRESFYRVLEIDADAALSYLQGMLTITSSTEDAAEGRGRVRGEARAPMEGTMSDGRRDERHDWGPLVGDLAQRKARALEMGGEDRSNGSARSASSPCANGSNSCSMPARGSSTACSPTTWTPVSAIATSRPTARSPASARSTAGSVAVAAYDFTVMAGSMGAVGENKIARMRGHAVRQRIPFVWLLDSAGARIQSTSGSTFAGAGALFREQVAMSGVVPMVAAMLGHCAAGTAYIPALADFVPMVKGTSSMALGGRHLVKAAVGEDVTEEEMGGSAVHTKISGVADLEVADDEECLAIVRKYLSFFPQHNQERPPTTTRDGSGRPPHRGALRHRADRAAARVRHAQGRDADRRRRRRVLDEARVGEEPRHRVRARRWPAGRHRRRTNRWCSVARST